MLKTVNLQRKYVKNQHVEAKSQDGHLKITQYMLRLMHILNQADIQFEIDHHHPTIIYINLIKNFLNFNIFK